MIFTNMTLAIIMCLAYSLFLVFLFFSKDNAKNEETKIYKIMLILNVVGLLLHLAAENVCYYYYEIPYVLSFVVLKAMLIYYYLFGLILLTYLVVVSQLSSKREIQKIIGVFSIVVPIAFLFMPIRVYRDVNKLAFYTYGLDCNFTYYLSAIVILIMVCILAIQYKKIERKKIIPLILFVIGCTISVAIQRKYPHITIVDLIEALICCLMYFTIENPYENNKGNDSEPELLEESIEEKYKRLREARMKELEEKRMKELEEKSVKEMEKE